MKNLWHRLNELIQQQQSKLKPEPPFVHDHISARLVSQEDYLMWLSSPMRLNLYNHVQSTLRTHDQGLPTVSNSIQILSQDTTFGLVIYCKDFSLTINQYLCILEECKAKLEATQYVKNQGDVRSRRKGELIEKIYRYYFKPSIKTPKVDGKYDQLYGNITISHVLKDGQAGLLKVLINSYSDRNYTRASKASDLAHLLFSSGNDD